MAFGKPVIATDIGGNPEVIGSSGESGLLVPAESPDLFADAILELVRNESLRIDIGKSARERIHVLCNIEKFISTYEDLFIGSLNKN
mgnify:CR=1 FL=1